MNTPDAIAAPAEFPEAALLRPHPPAAPVIPYPTAPELDAVRQALVDAGHLTLAELRDLVRMVAAAAGQGHATATLTLHDDAGRVLFAVTA